MKLLSGRHVRWSARMVFLFRWSDGEGMYGAFCLDSRAEVGSLQLIAEFGESCRWQRQTQFGSGEISENQLYVCW